QARARERSLRRAARPVPAQRRRPLLHELGRIRGRPVRARSRWTGKRRARTQRHGVLSPAVLVVRYRKEVPRSVRSTLQRAAKDGHGAAAGLVRAAEARRAAGARNRGSRSSRSGDEIAMPQVHQILASLGYGDAIGNEVLAIQRVLNGAGYSSEIFVETADKR